MSPFVAQKAEYGSPDFSLAGKLLAQKGLTEDWLGLFNTLLSPLLCINYNIERKKKCVTSGAHSVHVLLLFGR